MRLEKILYFHMQSVSQTRTDQELCGHRVRITTQQLTRLTRQPISVRAIS